MGSGTEGGAVDEDGAAAIEEDGAAVGADGEGVPTTALALERRLAGGFSCTQPPQGIVTSLSSASGGGGNTSSSS